MFTKQDYIEYFQMIREKEIQMIDFWGRAMGLIEDPGLKKFFEEVMSEEKGHAALAQRLIEIVEA